MVLFVSRTLYVRKQQLIEKSLKLETNSRYAKKLLNILGGKFDVESSPIQYLHLCGIS